MLKIKTVFLLLTSFTLIGLISACDQQKTGSGSEGVVATVNGKPITEFDVTLASHANTSHMQPPAADKKDILESIIIEELAYQKAIKLGLDKDEQYQKDLKALDAQVHAFKRKKMSDLLLRKQMLQAVEISDDEAQQYFKQHEQQLRTELDLWQILSRNEDAIKKMKSDLDGGMSFEKVAAQQFPTLKLTDKKPWELGRLQWHQLPESWHNVISNMQVGDTSDIIPDSSKRFWIIKLVNKRVNTELTFEQIKPRIIDLLKKEKYEHLRETTLKDLKENANIKYMQAK